MNLSGALSKRHVLSVIENSTLTKDEKRDLAISLKTHSLDSPELLLLLISYGLIKAGGRYQFGDFTFILPVNIYLQALLEGIPTQDLDLAVSLSILTQEQSFKDDFENKSFKIPLEDNLLFSLTKTKSTILLVSIHRGQDIEDEVASLAEAFGIPIPYEPSPLFDLMLEYREIEQSLLRPHLPESEFYGVVRKMRLCRDSIEGYKREAVSDRRLQVILNSISNRIARDLETALSFYTEANYEEASHRINTCCRDFKSILRILKTHSI